MITNVNVNLGEETGEETVEIKFETHCIIGKVTLNDEDVENLYKYGATNPAVVEKYEKGMAEPTTDTPKLPQEFAGMRMSRGWFAVGTMKLEHLLESIQFFLERDDVKNILKGKELEYLDEIEKFLDLLNMADELCYEEIYEKYREEGLFFLTEELEEFLNDIAPAGTTYDTIEGDGADYGFWMLN